MKKPKPAFDEHRVRNDFVKLIDSQPAKVQVRMCIMALLQVLNHIRTDVGLDEAMIEMMELNQLIDMVQGWNSPSTREH